METKRQLELDLLKALTIPLMITIHIAETVFSRVWEDMHYCEMTSGWQIFLF